MLSETSQAVLLAIVTSLGSDSQDGKYIVSNDCAECLKDLKQLVRQDKMEESYDFTEKVLEWNVIGKHLKNIILFGSRELMFSALELLIAITLPVSPQVEQYVTIQTSWRQVKFQMTDIPFLQHLLKVYSETFSDDVNNEEFDEDKYQLILVLFRNMLVIPDADNQSVIYESLGDNFVISLYKSGWFKILISIVSSFEDSGKISLNLLLLEIFYRIIYDKSVDLLFHRYVEKEQLEYVDILQKESLQKLKKSRHSRFGGIIRSKLATGNDYFILEPSKSVDFFMESGKKDRYRRQKQTVDQSTEKYRKFYRVVYKILREFIESALNPLTLALEKEYHTLPSEPIHLHFLTLATFCLKFVFLSHEHEGEQAVSYECIYGLIEVANIRYVISHIEMYITEKSMMPLYACLSCYKEIVSMVSLLMKDKLEIHVDTASQIASNIFYDNATLVNIRNLTKLYKQFPKSCITKLIEINHSLLCLLKEIGKDRSLSYVSKTKRSRKDEHSDSDQDNGLGLESDIVVYEKEYEYEKFESEYCNDGIVSAYIYVLTSFAINKPHINEFIICLLESFFSQIENRPIFCKLTYLNAFQVILQDQRIREYPHILAFIDKVLDFVMSKIREYPLMFCELLYPKGFADCKRIRWGMSQELLPQEMMRDTQTSVMQLQHQTETASLDESDADEKLENWLEQAFSRKEKIAEPSVFAERGKWKQSKKEKKKRAPKVKDKDLPITMPMDVEPEPGKAQESLLELAPEATNLTGISPLEHLKNVRKQLLKNKLNNEMPLEIEIENVENK